MRFYKILHKDNLHHGFKYKVGLNIDTISFNPSGDCEPGGLYYSREDILAFLGFGDYIAEVIVPEDAQTYENCSIHSGVHKWKADKIILKRRKKITPEIIKKLIEEGANPNVSNGYPLYWAIDVKRPEMVKALISGGANVSLNSNRAILEAIYTQDVESVRYLIEGGAVVDQFILNRGITPRNPAIQELLLNAVGYIEDYFINVLFMHAAENGWVNIIKILINKFGNHIRRNDDSALKTALDNKQLEIAKELLIAGYGVSRW